MTTMSLVIHDCRLISPRLLSPFVRYWFDEGARFLENSDEPKRTRVLEGLEEAFALLAEIKG